MRTIHGAVLAAALCGSVSVTMAQNSTTAPAAQKNYTKSLTFDLPVRMDADFRATLSEVRLFVKAPGAPWKLQEQGPAQTTVKFQCRTPQDGEYWYTLVTVDRAGRATPADVNLEPPSQRVIIDTTVPIIQVQTGNTPDGDLCLRCTVLDANPDHATLKAVCRTETGDITLEIVPNQPGCFRVRGPEMLRFPVVVSVRDLAGNLGTKEVNLRDMIGAAFNPAPAKTPADIALTGVRPELKGVPPQPINSVETPMQKSETPMQKPETVHRVETPPVPQPQPPAIHEPINKLPAPPIENTQRNATSHQLINTTNASIEYRIDQVGPSGVGKVEVYMTPDNGQTWHKLGEDTDKRSPGDFNLPGDGVYGIRIVVTNGNGFGGKAPVRGDAPQCTVEVDTTSPFIQLRSTDLMPSTGHVEIRWNATDKNLAAEPVTLSYRTRTDGPWQVIARNVRNDGMYRWAFPRDAGGQFFFKAEITDQAGNLSQDVTRQPVVIDMTEPRATVVGVSGTGTPRPSLGGN